MGHNNYSESEQKRIKALAEKHMTDKEIASTLNQEFNNGRTELAISRYRGRMGYNKSVPIHLNKARVREWTQFEVNYIKSNYQIMDDAEIAEKLTLMGRPRSAGAVQMYRAKMGYSRERFRQPKKPVVPKPMLRYERHFIEGGMTAADRQYIDWLKTLNGTYKTEKEDKFG